MEKYTRWGDGEIKFLRENYHLGSKFCSEKLGRTRGATATKIEKLGFRLTKEQDSLIKCNSRHVNIDPNQFYDIKTPELAYFLGFFWADGTILSGDYLISLIINSSDAEVLKETFYKIGKWPTASYIRKRNNKDCYSTSFRVGNKLIWTFLKDHDYHIKSGASADKILSKIPDHLKHYWWRGFFDGDGYWDDNGLIASFTSGAYQDWSFAEKLCNDLSVSFDIFRKRYSKDDKIIGNSAIIMKKAPNLVKFGQYIYQNYENDKVGLYRKYKNYLLSLKKDEYINYKPIDIEFDKQLIRDDIDYRVNKIVELIKLNNYKISRRNLIKYFNVSNGRIQSAQRELRKNKLVKSVNTECGDVFVYTGE